VAKSGPSVIAANLLRAALDDFFVIGVVVVVDVDEFIDGDDIDDDIDDDIVDGIDDFVVVAVGCDVTSDSSCSVDGFVIWENRRVLLLIMPCVGIKFPAPLSFILRFADAEVDVDGGVRCTPDNAKKASAK